LKRVLLVFIVCLLLLVSLLLVNTLRFSSKQMQVEQVSPLSVDVSSVAQHLSQAIRFRTVSFQDMGQINGEEFIAFHKYLEQTFQKVHATLIREAVSNYSLLYTWKGKNEKLKPILLMAHQDIVPVEPVSEADWQQPPFEGRIYDGFIWGRGTMDDKAGVLGLLEAVEILLDQGFQPERTIYLAFGHDEEVGGQNGAAKIAELLLSRNVGLEYILDEGLIIADGILPVPKPVAAIGIAEKGSVSLELSVEAQGGHSSMPPSQTAIGILGRAVNRLEEEQMPGEIKGAIEQTFDYIGPEMSFGKRLVFANLWLFKPLVLRQLAASPAMSAALHTTTAATIIEGGVKENVLPTRARAVVNFRISPGNSIESVIAHVKDAIADSRVKINKYGVSAWEPSNISDINSPNFQALERTVRQVFPKVLVAPAQVIGATDSRHYEKLTHNIYRFLPQRYNQDDLKRPHGVNERISIEDYSQCIRFYHQLIRNTAQ
jgi:carboxypeptidase PM20D1